MEMAGKSSTVKPLNIPRVIGFAFRDYRADEVTKTRSAECRSCGGTVKEKAGTTSNFLRHLRKHHAELSQLYQDSKQSGAVLTPTKILAIPTSSNSKSDASTSQSFGPVTRKSTAPPPVKSTALNKNSVHPSRKSDILTESVVDFIIEQSLPVDIVKSRKFNNFLKKVNPKFKPITCEAAQNEVKHRSTKISADVCKRISSASSVNATVNVWSDGLSRFYIAVTAHLIEEHADGLQLSSLLLSCQRIVGKQNSSELVSTFSKIMDDFGIDRKLDYVIISDTAQMKIAHSLAFMINDDYLIDCTLDNGGYLDDDTIWCALDEQSEHSLKAEIHDCARYARLKCFAHTLSQCVHEVIAKTECIRYAVMKVCCLVTATHSSPELARLFTEGGTDLRTLLCNTKKWEETLKALKAIIFCDPERLREVSPPHIAIDFDEFEMLQELDGMMQPFLTAVEQTREGINYSISVVVPTVLSLYKHLLNVRVKAQHLHLAATELADSLYCNFKGVFASVGMTGPEVEVASMHDFGESIYVLASVLDPTYGLSWLRDVHADENAKSILRKRVLDDVLIESESRACLESSISLRDDENDAPPRKAMKLYAQYKKEDVGSSNHASASSQLQEYLKMAENGCEGFTCFQFWAKYKSKFHLLYPVARRVLAIPATLTAIERVFARGGIVTKQNQASLSDHMLTNLIFLKANETYQVQANT